MSSIEERMDLIEENVRRLKGTKINSSDFYHFQGVKHTLQETVEACIDIASRIISEEGMGRGDSYSDYFETLDENNIISSELAEKLEKMAKFRNLVVHRYMEVEEEELQRRIDQDLDDFIDFIEEVKDYKETEDA